MTTSTPTLTLLTDFGTTDYYVAAVRGVLRRLAPRAVLADVSHEVEPGDVAGAAWLLAAAARWFPAGSVHLAVVDPGVGSSRRILALRSGAAWLVAPDNGLLTPFLDGAPACWREGDDAAQGAPAKAPDLELRAVDRDDLFLPGPGATFHGRDRFAPVAAYLARGDDFTALGPTLDDPVRLPLDPPTHEGDPPAAGTAGAVLHGHVVHVDRFGNLVTDVPAAWLGDAACRVEVGWHTTERRVSHFAELPSGQVGVLVGSLGTLELSLDGASLAERWELGRGTRVTVRVVPHTGG
jgi:S-adenosylmethionine hydrolase